MLTKDDLKSIENLVKPIKETLESHTGSIMSIEQKIDAALELRQDVSEIRTTVTDHEERITQLETL